MLSSSKFSSEQESLLPYSSWQAALMGKAMTYMSPILVGISYFDYEEDCLVMAGAVKFANGYAVLTIPWRMTGALFFFKCWFEHGSSCLRSSEATWLIVIDSLVDDTSSVVLFGFIFFGVDKVGKFRGDAVPLAIAVGISWPLKLIEIYPLLHSTPSSPQSSSSSSLSSS